MTDLRLHDAPAGAAHISSCGRYRYMLRRSWSGDPRAVFVMLNPSTADALQDDPTIRRCIGFAKAWGCGGLWVGNLYAYRATNPRDLWTVDDPVGPDNDLWLASCALGVAGPVVAAWGAHARPDRVDAVRRLPGMGSLEALGVTTAGAPRHPLYLPKAAQLAPWPTEVDRG